MVILENIDIDIDIDKAILQNINIDKISNRFKFGISNRATVKLPNAMDTREKTSSEIRNQICNYNLENTFIRMKG